MRILIGVTGKRTAIKRRKTRNLVRTIFTASGFPKGSGPSVGELSLVFSDDSFISELNLRYLGRKGPTNVLAFPLSEEESEFLAEIIISVETAAREARGAGISREERLAQLLVHGILHLLGYDHRDRRETGKMSRKEQEILKVIKKSEK
ncbi:MAG: rRNA maturation RNase YbeY [Proteobacteria bacterium]|nr:rRNA maturation RNase YbeY [Pseudomonadota bacterium]